MGFASYNPDGSAGDTLTPVPEAQKTVPLPADTTPELTPKQSEVLPAPDESLSKQKFVVDTMHNRTSVNTDRFAQVIADLKGYAEGSAVKVTYFKQQYAESNSKGIQNDADISQHQSHKSMLKIHGFEIRLTGSLQYEHDAADNIVHVTGEALTYPGFEPSKGDRFLMEVETGKWAEMSVTDLPTRMAIKSSTYYKIVFAMTYWMTPQREAILNDAVWNEAWFDKKRFLNEQGALLYHAEYVDMKFMELQSAQMVMYYVNKFLDKNLMYTYMRPSGVYDPYVTDFMLQILEYGEAGSVAQQLYRDAPAMETNIWRALLSETVPLAAVPTGSVVLKRKLGSKTVMINSLLNKQYLAFEPTSTSLMAFFAAEEEEEDSDDPCEETSTDDLEDESDNIIGDLLLHIHPHYHECVLTCCGNCTACGDSVVDDTNSAVAYMLDGSAHYKEMIRLFLKTRKINVVYLRECIKNVYSLPLDQQFYKMPIYIFLARTFVRYMHKEAGIYE